MAATLQPLAFNSFEIAAPIPRLPPVTTATRFITSSLFLFLWEDHAAGAKLRQHIRLPLPLGEGARRTREDLQRIRDPWKALIRRFAPSSPKGRRARMF